MLKKIVSIKNVGKFNNYSSRGDVSLRNLNIIYFENGCDKTGRTHPEASSIPDEYRYLLEWYVSKYFDS